MAQSTPDMGYLRDGYQICYSFFSSLLLPFTLLATTDQQTECNEKKTLSQIVPGQKLNNFVF